MTQLDNFKQVIATYQRHGWDVKRILTSEATQIELADNPASNAGLGLVNAVVEVSMIGVDAIWFARASHEGREAWELRLVSDIPYALFETFEADEVEEERAEVRLEMEAKLRDYATRSHEQASGAEM